MFTHLLVVCLSCLSLKARIVREYDEETDHLRRVNNRYDHYYLLFFMLIEINLIFLLFPNLFISSNSISLTSSTSASASWLSLPYLSLMSFSACECWSLILIPYYFLTIPPQWFLHSSPNFVHTNLLHVKFTYCFPYKSLFYVIYNFPIY